MKPTNQIIAAVLIPVACLTLLTSCSTRKEIEDVAKKIAERAFFEGQRAALTGDVRIKYDTEAGCWRWVKSPWDDGTPAVTDISGIKSRTP